MPHRSYGTDQVTFLSDKKHRLCELSYLNLYMSRQSNLKQSRVYLTVNWLKAKLKKTCLIWGNYLDIGFIFISVFCIFVNALSTTLN